METPSIRVMQGGRLVGSAAVRKMLNIHTGDWLNIQSVESAIQPQSRPAAVHRIQALIRRRISKARAHVDDLLAGRRASAQP